LKGVVAIYTDINDKKRLEAQLRQADRMESIGTLAGGIAHDFNNLLMGIQGRTSLMVADLRPDHPHFEHLTEIEKSFKVLPNSPSSCWGLPGAVNMRC